jgi:hypothetical protein
MLGGFIAGVAATGLFAAWAGKAKVKTPKGVRRLKSYEPRILIWKTKKDELHSRMASYAGGSTGVSHVTVDLGEVDKHGRRLMVDCMPNRGVVRVPRNKYGAREYATVILSGKDGRETAGAIRASVGLPYDSLAMISGLIDPDLMTCSTLVFHALPENLKEKVRGKRAKGQIGVAVTPSQLLIAFGAEVGGEPVVI